MLDRVIVTPVTNRTFSIASNPSVSLPVYLEGRYDVSVAFESPTETEVLLGFKVDGGEAGTRRSTTAARINNGSRGQVPLNARLQINLTRGTHTIGVDPVSAGEGDPYLTLTCQQRPKPPSPEKRASHYRLFGMEPGERPCTARRPRARSWKHFCRRRSGVQ